MTAASAFPPSILPPSGAPVDAVVKAVEAIVARAQTVELEELRAAAAARADLTAGIAVTLLRQRRTADAVGLLHRFLDSHGPDPVAYDALGAIHLASDEADGAIAAFRAALEINPQAGNAASNLYNLLLNLKRWDEAVDVLGRYPQAKDGAPDRTLRAAQKLMITGASAIAVALLEPIAETADACCALGEAHFRQGRIKDAHGSWDKALEIDPDHLQTLVKRAIGYNLQGKHADAGETIDKAYALNPEPVAVRVTRAMILTELARADESIEILVDILDKDKPEHADGWAVLSKAYNQQGQGKEAKEAAENALALEEDNFFGRQNLVLALLRCHDNRAAEREARRTVELIRNGHYKFGFNVDNILFYQLDMLGQALSRQGLADVAHDMRCEYIDDPQVNLQFFQNYLFEMHYATGLSAEFIGRQHRKIRRMFQPEQPIENFSTDPTKRMRLGFFSADFRHHSCGYFMFALLSGLKELDVDIICLSNAYAQEDDLTEAFRELADEWIEVKNQSVDEVRPKILDAQLDVMVDCVGYTAGARTDLFAARCAPVQVIWLGYPDGSGLDTMDYRLTDRLAEPENADDCYSEQLVRLPRGFLCFPEYEGAPDVEPTPAIESGRITFGCFNSVPKLNDEVIDAWARIVNETPNARLLLKSSYVEEDSVDALRQRFVDMGVAEDAIELMPWTAGKAAHMAVYNKIDINLDPFPYNGTTTTMEATFMGVPSVVLRGTRHSGLVGVALMTRFGMPDLIGEDVDDYVAIATRLASDIPRLNALRLGVRDRMRASEIMSNQVFAQDVHDAFRTMWIKHCESHGAEVKSAAMAPDAHALDVVTRAGVNVSVPATIRELSTYILLEQEDWFEAELPFVRHIAQPGWRMLDIGANYGLYGLTIAAAGGPDVRVAAFEPAARTARYLRRSVDKNGFEDQFSVIQSAMSDTVGEAVLDLGAPELKALTTTGRGETVRTSTIDVWTAENPDFAAPDFVKIDAEGAESRILAGGEAFFETADPLVLLEVKHGGDFNFSALDKLVALGYGLFALAPGLNILAPANPRAARLSPEALDGYCLNLFSCKPSRRAQLAAAGLLVEERVAADPDVDPAGWERALDQRPFWPAFRALKADFTSLDKTLPGARQYQRALARVATAEDRAVAPAARLAALEAAKQDAESALSYHRSPERLMTASRIALMLGRRDFAVRALREVKMALSQIDLTIAEPFLPPLMRYDDIDGRADFISWFEAAVLEAYELSVAYSSYFSGERAFDLYEALDKNPFASPEILRRRLLQRLRHRLDSIFSEEPRLTIAGPGHANATLWRESGAASWAA